MEDRNNLSLRGSIRIALAVEGLAYSFLVGISLLSCALAGDSFIGIVFLILFTVFVLFAGSASRRMKKEAEHYGLYVPENDDNKNQRGSND